MNKQPHANDGKKERNETHIAHSTHTIEHALDRVVIERCKEQRRTLSETATQRDRKRAKKRDETGFLAQFLSNVYTNFVAAFLNKIWITTVKDERNISLYSAFIAYWWWTVANINAKQKCFLDSDARAIKIRIVPSPKNDFFFLRFVSFRLIIIIIIIEPDCDKSWLSPFSSVFIQISFFYFSVVFRHLVWIDSVKLIILVSSILFCPNLACCTALILDSSPQRSHRMHSNEVYCNYPSFSLIAHKHWVDELPLSDLQSYAKPYK